MTLPEGFPRLEKQEGRKVTYCATTGENRRSCQCRSCLSGRNHRKGHRKQDMVRKWFEDLTGTKAKFAGRKGNEESWFHLPVRLEVKAGKQVGPVWTAYAKQEAQSDQAKPFGDARTFVGICAPDDMSDFLLTFRSSTFDASVRALGYYHEDDGF